MTEENHVAQPYERLPIVCPKCGSKNMEERHIKDMWMGNRKGAYPMYGAASDLRVVCFDCQTQVWPVKVLEVTEAGKKMLEKKGTK